MDASGFDISGLTAVGIVTIAGFYVGRVAKRMRLPSIIGYMILGVLVGPSLFHLIGEPTLDSLGVVTEVALGFVAFSIGTELNIASLKRLGAAIVSIILFESFMAFFIVLGAVYALTRDLPMALVFGAMAPASAPAGTVAVIQEAQSKGNLTKALYAVVGFDDGLAIIIFGFAAAIAKSLLLADATGVAGSVLPSLAGPAKEIGLSLIVGAVVGFGFCFLVQRMQNSRDIFIILFGAVVLTTGLSLRWHLSLILTNMILGFVLVNTRREALVRRVIAPLADVMPLLFVLFFGLAGAHLKVEALPALGLIGVVYIMGRTAGKLSGAWLGAVAGDAEAKLRKYVGMGILSQAGVAIGLSLIVKHEFTQLAAEYDIEHALYIGTSVLTTITATSIFFEIIGPILTKIALTKAGEVNAAVPGK